MPLQSRHEAQSEHNKGMLGFIDTNDNTDGFRDWYVTVAYYTALHYFEAILPIVVPKINSRRKISLLEEHYYDHGERLIAMADVAEFIYIHKPYSTLHKISKAAKYNEYDITLSMKISVRGYLTMVEDECNKLKRKYK